MALFFDKAHMLQCIFVSLGACLESKIAFSLLERYGTDPDAWLIDCCDTYLICLIQTFLELLGVNSASIYHFLCAGLF